MTSAGMVESRPRFRSHRTSQFTESVIREMTRLAIQHDAVNLAQGFPDFSAPEEIKRAAQDAIAADFNQYAITWGAKPFREAIAAKYRKWYRMDVDPEREITVCCGATEGMIAALLAVTNPGDEIIIFEPYRKLRSRCIIVRRTTQAGSPFASGLELRSRRTAPRVFFQDQSDHPELAQ